MRRPRYAARHEKMFDAVDVAEHTGVSDRLQTDRLAASNRVGGNQCVVAVRRLFVDTADGIGAPERWDPVGRRARVPGVGGGTRQEARDAQIRGQAGRQGDPVIIPYQADGTGRAVVGPDARGVDGTGGIVRTADRGSVVELQAGGARGGVVSNPYDREPGAATPDG